MGFLENLVKPELLYGNGQPPQYFNSPQDALNAGTAMLPPSPGLDMAPQANVNFTPAPPPPATAPPMAPQEQGPPQISASGGGPQLTPSPTGPLPFYNRPTFQQATTDQYGDTKPATGLTKGGVLLSFLQGAMRGGSAAIASGALNAAPGKSGFGSGWAGAQNEPLQHAAMQQQLQHSGLENQQLAAQTKYMPEMMRYKMLQAQADVDAKRYTPLRGSAGGALENSTGAIVGQNVRDQNVPIDQQTFNSLTNPGANGEPAAMTPQAAYAYINKIAADAKADARPDGATKATQDYQATMTKLASEFGPGIGKLDPGPLAKVIAGSKTLSQPEKDSAIAYPMAHPTPGATKFNMEFRTDAMQQAQQAREMPVMERKVAQVELDSTNALTAHNKEISARVSKLDPGDPAYANQMAQVERDDYLGKSQLARGYAKARTAMGLPTQPPTFDPWTNSYLTDDERAKLIAGSTSPAKPSGLPPWVKKGSNSTTNRHLPGNPYVQ